MTRNQIDALTLAGLTHIELATLKRMAHASLDYSDGREREREVSSSRLAALMNIADVLGLSRSGPLASIVSEVERVQAGVQRLREMAPREDVLDTIENAMRDEARLDDEGPFDPCTTEPWASVMGWLAAARGGSNG